MSALKRYKSGYKKRDNSHKIKPFSTSKSSVGTCPTLLVMRQENDIDTDFKKLVQLEINLASIEARIEKLENNKCKCQRRTTSERQRTRSRSRYRQDKEIYKCRSSLWINDYHLNNYLRNSHYYDLPRKELFSSDKSKRRRMCKCLSKIICGKNDSVRNYNSDTTVTARRRCICNCHRSKSHKNYKFTRDKSRRRSGYFSENKSYSRHDSARKVIRTVNDSDEESSTSLSDSDIECIPGEISSEKSDTDQEYKEKRFQTTRISKRQINNNQRTPAELHSNQDHDIRNHQKNINSEKCEESSYQNHDQMKNCAEISESIHPVTCSEIRCNQQEFADNKMDIRLPEAEQYTKEVNESKKKIESTANDYLPYIIKKPGAVPRSKRNKC